MTKLAILTLLIMFMVFPLCGSLVSVFGLLNSKKHWKIYILIISLFFALFAYCYVPENSGPDIYRYFQYILSFRDANFYETVIKATYHDSHLYVFNFLVWISNQLLDEHLVPFVSVFSVYFICLYCTCKVGIICKARWKYVAIYIVFALCTLDWYSLTNNVRNVFAFALAGFAAFEELYEGKRNALVYLCYIIPIFIHPIALLFVGLRLALFFIKNK